MTKPASRETQSPKGKPLDFTPDIAAETERLWTTTAIPPKQIAALLNEKFGVSFSTSKICHYANRHGFMRYHVPAAAANQHVRAEVRALAELELAFRPTPPVDNPMRRVAPGTFPARGFTMIGGRTNG